MRKKQLLALCLAMVCLVAAFALAACGQQSQSSASAEASSEAAVEQHDDSGAFYALLVGNDSRYGTTEGEGIAEDDPSYGDTIMLMRVDPTICSISLLSIPRDTAAVVDGVEEKINSSHLTGINSLVKQVEQLTGAKIDYYFDMKFFEFTQLIDQVDGVTVDVPVDMSWKDIVNGGKITLTAGDNQTLDGSEALVFVRQRKLYADNGEACRQINGREVVKQVISAIAQQPDTQAESYATILEGLCKTNMDHEQLVSLVQTFMQHDGDIIFQLGTGPYEGDIDSTETWRVTRDEATYAKLIQAMENNSDLTAIVTPPIPVINN